MYPQFSIVEITLNMIFSEVSAMVEERTTLSEDNIPDKYRQPTTEYKGRIVRNYKEFVTYSSSSHVRIWYNNQTEGYELHSHDAMEAFICIQNNYEIHVNNTIYKLKEGDILIIPPNMPHEYVNDKYGVRFIYLVEMSYFFDSHDYSTIEPLFFNGMLINEETCPDIYKNVYNLFMDINSCYFTHSNFWETTVYSKLYQVFIEVAKHSENNLKDETSNSSQSIERINSLLRYMDINYSEEMSTEQAAEFTGFSKFHFMRLFKLQTGYTFHDYLTLKRIHMAQLMLLTNKPITEIAFESGFSSLPTFCRAFKKYTNYSPSDYKKLRRDTIETENGTL